MCVAALDFGVCFLPAGNEERNQQEHKYRFETLMAARAMPVLPDVASISVSPGFIRPAASARLVHGGWFGV